MFDWMNKNAGALNVLFSLVVAVSTVVYARLTALLVTETSRMRKAQTNPHISVYVEPSEAGLNFITLHVRNTGPGPARNVRLRLERDYEWMRGRRLSERGIFRHPMPYLAPGQGLSTFLLSILEHVKEGQDTLGHLNFTVYVEYESELSEKFSDMVPVTFEHFEGLMGIGTPPLISMSRDMDRIRSAVERVASGFAKVRTVTSTVAEERAEMDALVARHDSRAREQNDGSAAS